MIDDWSVLEMTIGDWSALVMMIGDWSALSLARRPAYISNSTWCVGYKRYHFYGNTSLHTLCTILQVMMFYAENTEHLSPHVSRSTDMGTDMDMDMDIDRHAYLGLTYYDRVLRGEEEEEEEGAMDFRIHEGKFHVG